MAGKKKPSLEEAINIFEDAMNRSSLSDYLHVNRIIISKNPKEQSIIVVPDQTLWNALIEKEEFKSHLKELDLNNSIDREIGKISKYGEDLDNNAWIDIDSESLYTGKLVKIKIDNLEYELSINKNLIPLKLKKTEFNNISYRVFSDMTLALKKKFEYPLEDHGFSMIRIFQIV